MISATKKQLAVCLEISSGIDAAAMPNEMQQQLEVSLGLGITEAAEDPDRAVCLYLLAGVWQGFDKKLPRKASVFAERTQWQLPPPVDHHGAQWL